MAARRLSALMREGRVVAGDTGEGGVGTGVGGEWWVATTEDVVDGVSLVSEV